ncbi:MAG TPA: hypothetical protein VMZ73_01960 [Acidimicrobiales bacterium]|nr:hypothetical protein [Acidimicrobiales bacterium]
MTSNGCHRFVASALLAALVLVGCEASKVDRAATVTVSGRVIAADGTPATGITVGLERNPSVGEVLTGLVAVPLTFFTACLTDPPPRLCQNRDIDRATTAADGSYSFSLTGREAQTSFGNAVSFSLSTAVPPLDGELSGAAVMAEFRIQSENLRLPDLQVWQPKVTVTPDRVTYGPPAGGATTYQVAADDAASNPVWSFEGTRSEVKFDARILEDTSGSLAVVARTEMAAEGTTVTVHRRSGRVAYRSAAGPPASRGRPCTVVPAVTPVSPCSLTDGDFTNRLPKPPLSPTTTSTVAPTTESATIDLGRAVDVALVVVRGCACQVERSTDGQAWTPLGRSAGFTAVAPTRAGAARYVRITGPLSDLREVSVW